MDSTPNLQAAYGSYLDSLISQAGVFAGSRIQENLKHEEEAKQPTKPTNSAGQLASAYRTRLTNTGSTDASAYGVSPLFMSPDSPTLQAAEVFSGTGASKAGAMAMAPPSSTAAGPSASLQDTFGPDAACMQGSELPSSCAAITSSSSASALDLLSASVPGASISSASASSISSLLSGGETSPDLPATTIDSMFDFDLSAYDSMMPPMDVADGSAALFSTTHLPAPKANVDFFGSPHTGHGQGNQDAQQQEEGTGKLTSWTVQRVASSSDSSDSSDSMSAPQSSDEKPRPASSAAGKRATPSPRKGPSRARTRRRRPGKRRNDAGRNVAGNMCTMRGRSAINKRCVLDNGDIDHEKLERTRQIARRSYWRRRNAEMREQDQLKKRLNVLDKTKDALLSQKASLVSEREQLLHQLKAHMQSCF